MRDCFINGRFLGQRITGVQRYARGVMKYLDVIPLVCPATGVFNAVYWEQFSLPASLRKKGSPLLLNFCNTAPAFYSNQVVCIHDTAVFENPQWFHPAFALYYRWLIPSIARSARHVVTVSEFSRSRISYFTNIPGEKISVIPGAVEDTLLTATPNKPFMSEEKPFVLMVGSHDPRKNVGFAIQHGSHVLKQLGHDLIIAGDPGQVFARTQDYGSPGVQWISGIDDAQLHWLYANARLVLQPSTYEGFGLVPLEALAFGTPVLVSDIPAHKEVLKEDAFYFKTNDPGDFQEKFRQLLKDPPKVCPTRAGYSFERSGKMWQTLVDTYRN